MIFIKRYATGILMSILACGAAANTVDVAGVKFSEGIELRGSKLVLNGAGVRYKAIFKVYAAGLYLEKKAETTEKVLAATGSKRMQLTMLREIDPNELGNLFVRGVNENVAKSELAKLIPGLIAMGKLFGEQKKFMPGDVITLDWVPGTGTVVSLRGVPQGEALKEAEFFSALMRIWLGNNPPDWKLKNALLGQSS